MVLTWTSNISLLQQDSGALKQLPVMYMNNKIGSHNPSIFYNFDLKMIPNVHLKITTLGVPVEPEVYITIAVSWGVGDANASLSLASGKFDESMFAPYRLIVIKHNY